MTSGRILGGLRVVDRLSDCVMELEEMEEDIEGVGVDRESNQSVKVLVVATGIGQMSLHSCRKHMLKAR